MRSEAPPRGLIRPDHTAQGGALSSEGRQHILSESPGRTTRFRGSGTETRLLPRSPCDAEYHCRDRVQQGHPADEAKGYGLWLAKVVAARKFTKWKTTQDLDRLYVEEAQARQYPPSKWQRLSGEEHTDQLFDQQIIERMGRDIYDQVFAPTIQQAYAAGKSYRDIRDTIRQEWKP